LAKILLNKSNFFHNLTQCAIQAGSKDKIAIVLKDNAYGHGLIEISTLSKEFGIKKAIVETVEEANKIKNLFNEILILKVSQNTTYSHTFHIAINNMCQVEQMPINTNVHLKIDTGMHRNGINPKDLEAFIYSIHKRNLNLTGIFTHYRSADCLSSEYFWQKAIFRELKLKAIDICEKLLIPIPSFHSSNSNALFRDNNFDEDFCRIGLAGYGYIYEYDLCKKTNLLPVLSLWGKKLVTKQLKKGEKVGYGGSFTAKEDMNIATYDIGYGDGFLRIDENQSFNTPNGAKLLGRVSMDSLSLNCQDDEVCIFDDIKILAKLNNTIYYEILTSLKPTIIKEIV
jgi:alanine racemase